MSEQQQHIDVPSPLKKPEVNPKPEPAEPGGLAKPVGSVLDPLGRGLETVLSPVGAVVSTVTKPVTNIASGVTKPVLGPVTGTHEEKAELLGGANLDSYEHGKDSLGGALQTGDNPLGLDQTGKFGFREESNQS